MILNLKILLQTKPDTVQTSINDLQFAPFSDIGGLTRLTRSIIAGIKSRKLKSLPLKAECQEKRTS